MTKKNTSLVTLTAKGEPVILSDILVEPFGYKVHEAVKKVIRKYRIELEKYGELIEVKSDSIPNSVELGIQYKKSSRGRKENSFRLNERQYICLLPRLKKTENSILFQDNINNQFFKIRKAFLEIKTRRSDPAWIETRQQSKVTRQECTDAIKDFIEYAKLNGSKGADHYYSIITKLEYVQTLDIKDGFPTKDLRNNLDNRALMAVERAETLIIKTIREGITLKTPYKEIYENIKTKLNDLAKLFGKTELLLTTPLLALPSST